MKTRTGADLVLDTIFAEGVDTVFGYPGGAIMPLYDAFWGHRVEHILVRHEAAAAFAASGYARTTGRVGVCVATSGPGATNLVTGIADAMLDNIPLVAITGQVRSTLMGTDAFQEVDIAGITRAITKRSVVVRSVEDIQPTLRDAFRLARGARPGPVLVDLPTDVLKTYLKARPKYLARNVSVPASASEGKPFGRGPRANACAKARRDCRRWREMERRGGCLSRVLQTPRRSPLLNASRPWLRRTRRSYIYGNGGNARNQSCQYRTRRS